MDVNVVGSMTAYEKTNASKKEEKLTVTDSSVSYGKTEQVSSSEKTVAVTYQKGSNTAKKVAKRDTATIEQMKAEAEQRNSQLRSLVEKMLLKQGKKLNEGTDIWSLLRKGELEVDPETAAQAKADIAEDGYWGVQQTSDRLVSFAKALAGNDSAYANELIDAIKKGFDEATKSWGDELPDLCKKTLDATISKMEAWRDGITE